MLKRFVQKYRAQLGSSIWSVAGLVLMSAVAQVVVFPLLASRLGEWSYGDLQYLMAYINIVTVSIGCAANLARMTAPADSRLENNGDYHLLLLAICLLGLPFTYLVRRFGGVEMDRATTICYYLLFVAMAFRYYADVSYKLTLRYKKYFVYYACISLGYLLGAFLFWKTGIWPLALLVGEAMGVLYAYIGDGTLRRNALRRSPVFGWVFKVTLVLFISEGISNLILNADRLILKLLIDASAVTVYYLATLVGKTVSLISISFNGVLLGYLARYQGKMTQKTMKWVTLGSLLSFVICTAGCVLGGLLVLLWLYPAEYAAVKPFLWAGSLAQVIYFTTSIVTVVLVRFAKKSYQIYINGSFAACFFGIGIPATVLYGLWGFAIAVIAANLIRWMIAVALGWYWAHKEDKMLQEKRNLENST